MAEEDPHLMFGFPPAGGRGRCTALTAQERTWHDFSEGDSLLVASEV